MEWERGVWASRTIGINHYDKCSVIHIALMRWLAHLLDVIVRLITITEKKNATVWSAQKGKRKKQEHYGQYKKKFEIHIQLCICDNNVFV